MIRYLTAFLLSFCIALPVCWCCAGESQKPEQTACCAMSGHCGDESSAPQKDDKKCPCARHEDMRDLTVTAVKAPVPELKPLFQPAWHESTARPAFTASSSQIAPRHDHGPPRSTPPVYALHCALLL
ncbi:hypothetical protein [Prosthecobacter sp.]|jgi:hypothetical protein|uniref:hypothetical protein n=1 Tax=Prosthecobacter sp. TaxID=1965333 RepID=UPI0037845160